MAKKATKKRRQATKTPPTKAERLGKWFGKRGPGSAKKLGRVSARAGKGVASFAKDFGKAFVEGTKEA